MLRSKTLYISFLVFMMSLFIYGCTGIGNGNGSDSTAEPTSELEDTTVSALAEVVPETWANLAFPNGGSDLDILVSVGDTVSTGDLLATVDDTAQQAAVSNAASALSSAQANLDRLNDLNASDSDISVAQKAVDAAQATLDQAQASLDATKMEAPFDGTIVDIFLRDYEIAAPNQPVILLADLNSLVIQTTDLSEVDVARVKVRDPATVVFDALPDVTATGRVARIALSPEVGAGTYYTVTINLDEIPEDLRWGMSAFVEIDTASNAPLGLNVTFIPTNTVEEATQTETNGFTQTPTYTPTKTTRRNTATPSITPLSGGGNPEQPLPTVTRTNTPIPPPTNTSAPTNTSQPYISPTPANTNPPFMRTPTYTPTP
jgi:RND family efflux transporter MFP subunit